LVELLTVVAIVSMLIALLLPAVQSARDAARRTQCVSNLKQLGLAVQNYEDAQGMLPIGNDALPPPAELAWWGPYNFSAYVRLLPYMEEQSLYDRFDLEAGLYMPHNAPLIGTKIEVLICPSDSVSPISDWPENYLSPVYDQAFTAAYANYVGSLGSRWFGLCETKPDLAHEYYNGVISDANSKVRLRDVTDGLSRTLLFGERARGLFPEPQNGGLDYGWWTSGYGGDTLFAAFNPINKAHRLSGMTQSNSDTMAIYGGAHSLHSGGANFCFADGSVDFLSENTDSWDLSDAEIEAMCDVEQPFIPEKLFQALSTRNGGEVIGDDGTGAAR
jgi:prepilin-type processing-associated H-X9-DG protein